jgi:hypothetical protein
MIRVAGALVTIALFTAFAAQRGPAAARYLFVWAGDRDRHDTDFLAVLNVQRRPGRYGNVIASVAAGESGLWVHHTEHELPASNMLFANGFAGNRSFVFDLHDLLRPRVTARFGSVDGLSFLHSFTRLPNGNVLATFQGHGEDNRIPGGLAELDNAGHVIRSASADDVAVDHNGLRPYSLAVVPSLDRVVVALAVMGIPDWHSMSRWRTAVWGITSRSGVYRTSSC